MLRRSLVYVYELIAFVTGFCLMAYELVASRLLAPTIGSSTYVWTSVIGVIIGALATGYAAGGWLADKRVAKQDIAWLLLVAAGTVLATLVFADLILALAVRMFSDARLQGLFASLLLFMPTSFILGMISPYLVRLRLESLATAGRSVAGLSALNSVGGIVGTFCVGFIFFGYFGSRQTLELVIVVLTAASFLIVPRYWLGLRLVLAGTMVFSLVFQFVQVVGAVGVEIDTPSSHYRVVDGEYNGRPVRVLTMGPGGLQSGIYTDGTKGLVFDYTRQMAAIVATAPHKDHILILGGGAFTLPQYLAQAYPQAQIDVAEIDPQLPVIAKKYFGYTNPSNVRIFAQDARTYLERTNQTYDVVLVDVYSDLAVPFSLTTTEYAQALDRVVAPRGMVAANVVAAKGMGCAPLLGAMHASYAGRFKNYKVFPQDDRELMLSQNIVIAYSNTELGLDALHPVTIRLPEGRQLSDNFAPVERLQQQCK
ncbi:MAG TPA: fused MFS/spermidine synthase [Nevskiaceae bacterium]|nr:fused MFS/spermidine synthase [Nevskiaceae bacterium]